MTDILCVLIAIIMRIRMCISSVMAVIIVSFQVHRGRYHCDGGCDLRSMLCGWLHCQSPGSGFHGPLWPQLSRWVSLSLYECLSVFLAVKHKDRKMHCMRKRYEPIPTLAPSIKRKHYRLVQHALLQNADQTFGAWTSYLHSRSIGSMH